jgi:hypothetical protein
MLHLARGAPRRGYASRPRPAVEVGRPSARDRRSFGRAHAGDTRLNWRASRRVGESTAVGLVPPLVNPECTSTALRRGHCARGPCGRSHCVTESDVTLRDSHGLRVGVFAGAGTRERVLDLWERLAPFGERARQAAEFAAARASGLHERVRRPAGPNGAPPPGAALNGQPSSAKPERGRPLGGQPPGGQPQRSALRRLRPLIGRAASNSVRSGSRKRVTPEAVATPRTAAAPTTRHGSLSVDAPAQPTGATRVFFSC